MDIEFIGPPVDVGDEGIFYKAKVDGRIVECHFSKRALEDVNSEMTLASSKEQFEASQNALLEIARKKIRNGKIADSTVTIFTADL